MQPSAAILIVDDHDGFRTFARGTLEPAGFTVTEAATGPEAADAARTIRPGLVLLDIQLPDSDGFEVARRPAAGFLPKDQLSGAALHRFLARTCREPRAAGRAGRGRDRRGGRPRRSRPVPSEYRLFVRL